MAVLVGICGIEVFVIIRSCLPVNIIKVLLEQSGVFRIKSKKNKILRDVHVRGTKPKSKISSLLT